MLSNNERIGALWGPSSPTSTNNISPKEAGAPCKAISFGNKTKIDQVLVDVSQVNPSEVDALLAQELNDMSLQERERAYEEIHGVHHDSCHMAKDGKLLEHSPEEEAKIRQALAQMQGELDRTPEKAAYEEAVAMKSPLVGDSDFRTKFVYVENFDAPKATKRMISYLELAKQLFGVQALHRMVQWADLSPKALELMNQGELQIPQLRDQSHRRICIVLKELPRSYSVKDRVSL